MKKYTVTIYTRSNEVVFQHIVEAKTAEQAKLYAWQYFDTLFSSLRYFRNNFRIEAEPFTAE